MQRQPNAHQNRLRRRFFANIREARSGAERELRFPSSNADGGIAIARREENFAPAEPNLLLPPSVAAARRITCRRQQDARARKNERESDACGPYASQPRPD